MIQEEEHQNKWDRILNLVETNTLGNIPRVSKTNPRSLSALSVGGTP